MKLFQSKVKRKANQWLSMKVKGSTKAILSHCPVVKQKFLTTKNNSRSKVIKKKSNLLLSLTSDLLRERIVIIAKREKKRVKGVSLDANQQGTSTGF